MKHALPTFVLTLAALLSERPATGQLPDQLKYSIPPPPTGVQSGAQLGYSVAVDGVYGVAGAPLDDVGGTDSGVVKVFNSVSGELLFVLANPSPANYDQFGNAVAISGSRVAVGAFGDDALAINAGSVYVYDLSSGTPTVPVAMLTNPSPVAGDNFGGSVAISGTRVIVGASGDDTGATDAGSVYVYDLSSGTPTVPVATLNNPSPAASDSFGGSVRISGTRAIVGASGDDTGASNAGSAYVYDLSSPTPTVPVVTLANPAPGVGDSFGSSVAISDARVVVGAPLDGVGTTDGRAFVFDLNGATPAVPVATFNDPNAVAGHTSIYSHRFGYSVAISGPSVVVGAWNDFLAGFSAGSAHVYDLNSGTPTVPVATVHNPGSTNTDFFGLSVSISNTRIVVGSYGNDTGGTDAGIAYIYEAGSATPAVPAVTLAHTGPTVNNQFGISAAVSGTRVVVGTPYDNTGATDSGSVYVYDLSSATPTVPVATLRNPNPIAYDYFGFAVAISGTRLVVGAPQGGAELLGRAYVYDLGSATPTTPVFTLNNPSPAAYDFFGTSVAVSGTRVVVGASGDDTGATDAGSVYVYNLAGGTPTVPVVVLNNPTPALRDRFGGTVAIAGAHLVVGASGDDAGATDSGTAYVYDLGSVTPAVVTVILNNPSPAANDFFGAALAISGTRVVATAPLHDAGATNAGSAYVFDLSSATPAVPVFTLINPSPTADGGFGGSAAISGTRVLVGSVPYNLGAADSGNPCVYDLSSPTPTAPVAVLNNPNPGTGNQFGGAVSIDGTTIAVGAPLNEIYDTGAAYIFGPSPYSLWKVSALSNQFAPDLGDADGDGLSNLGEYGLLRSPIIPNGAATSAAPALYAEGTRLRMFVTRDPARNDVTLEVQATGDLLGTWTTIATSTLGAPFTGPGYFGGDSATPGVKSVEVRDTVNLPDAPERFLRVRVRH